MENIKLLHLNTCNFGCNISLKYIYTYLHIELSNDTIYPIFRSKII